MLSKLLTTYYRAKQLRKIGHDLMHGAAKAIPKATGSKLRRGPIHLRRKLGSTVSQPIARKGYSGKIQITPGITGAQLNRKIIVHAVKKYSGQELAKAGGNRKLAAGRIQAQRKAAREFSGGVKGGPLRAGVIRPLRHEYTKRAAKVIAKIK